MTQSSERRPIPAVGIVCFRGDSVLLIKRGKPPRKGEWSLPGGHIEFGETAKTAALRELKEETGIEADLIGLLDVIDGIFCDKGDNAPAHHFVLIDYLAIWTSGEPIAADDASLAEFIPIHDIETLGMWPVTEDIIRKGYQQLNSN